jgi:signal transduction histidine kinase/ActR/RegA family two-component response regulator
MLNNEWLPAWVCASSVLAAIAIGVIARRRLQYARRLTTRLDLALSGGQMATWEWDVRSGRMSFWEGSEAVFGRTWAFVDEAWGCIHPEDVERIRNEVHSALREELRFRHVNRIIRADNGEVRWVETRAEVERNAWGAALHVTGVAIDVTERQLALDAAVRAEEALKRDNQLKDEFIAMLSHELRNPLAPIRYAAAVVNERATPAVLKRAREVIERQAGHLCELLDDLLDLSRISRNVIDLKRQSVDLRRLIETAIENAQRNLEREQQVLEYSPPNAAIWVRGDATRLLQVIGNLLDNAMRYTGRSGRIGISVTAASGHATIAITDTGVGLSAEMLPRIFDPFVQAHRPLGIRKGGLGVGLTLVKRLVELHGGQVTVTSAGLDRGSTFAVTLPLIAEPVHTSAHPVDQTAVTLVQRPRILIVDDHPDITEALGLFLRGEGFPTVVAEDGRTALIEFERVNPAVVVLDLGLPDLDGVDVARRIRGLPGGAHVPIIAVTGWGQEADRQRTLDAGVTQHLVKPIDPLSLVQAIDRVLGGGSSLPRRSSGEAVAP